jgi:hypothetical protein
MWNLASEEQISLATRSDDGRNNIPLPLKLPRKEPLYRLPKLATNF